MSKRQGVCTAIVFYELDQKYAVQPENLKSLFYFLEEWFIQNKAKPTRMSLSGANIPETVKTKSFSRYRKILHDQDFREISYFWMGHVPKDASSDNLDALLSVSFKTKQETHSNNFCLYFHNEIIAPNATYIEKLANDISNWIRPSYGIIYERDLDKGPHLYSVGIKVGRDKYLDSKDLSVRQDLHNIKCWYRRFWDEPTYQVGDLRDIYPFNILSEKHLLRDVHGTSLKDWINQDSDRGTLKKFNQELWLWRLEESQIEGVREALKDTGIVLCLRIPMD